MKYYIDWKQWLFFPFFMVRDLFEDIKDDYYQPGEKITLIFILIIFVVMLVPILLMSLPITWIFFIKRKRGD